MRVLVVRPGPAFSVADVCRGWVKGLRQNGCEVVDLNLDDRMDFYERAHVDRDGELVKAFSTEQAVLLGAKGIETACYEFWPDVVLIISGFYVPAWMYELLRRRGHKVVLMHTESPYEDDRQLKRAEWADVNIVNDPTNLGRFPNGHYFPHAFDPEIHRVGAALRERYSDFCFVGTGYPSRVEFFEAIDWSGVDVVLAGNMQWVSDDSPLRKFLIHDKEHCLPNEQAVEFYWSTKASANLYRREATEHADGWAMGPREVELAACGTFYLTEPRGENREVLPMVPTFEGPEEFSEKLRWYLAHPDERQEISTKALEAVQGRTFENHARQLLTLLKE